MTLKLDVYLEGKSEALGSLSRADDGSVCFSYTTDDLPHPLSLSLPVREEPFGDDAARGFFDNLLFENATREQVRARYGLEDNDIVSLLYHLGKDCPGAVSVVPEGEAPGKQPGDLGSDYDALSTDDVAEIVRSLRDHRRMPDSTGDPSPLAGVQGKVALTQLPDGRFSLPKHGTGAPTTHVLKVPRAGEFRLIDHEHKLMQIAASISRQPVAETQIIGDDDDLSMRGLLITRYDRQVESCMVHRIHQEDFCQALGLSQFLKYQRNGSPERCFSARAVGDILRQTNVPGINRRAFLEATILNLLLGNTDNHAKNHSLLYVEYEPCLAPLYDIVPTITDAQVTHQLSFDIGKAQMTDDLTAADLDEFVRHLGVRGLSSGVQKELGKIVHAVNEVIPDQRGPVFKRLGDAMAEQARWIAPALGLDIKVPERDALVINRP